MYHGTPGQIAVGRYVLQIGGPFGASIREATRAERAHLRPRPTPILQRPRLMRGLLDRQTELVAAFSALDAGLPVEVSGEPGVGKTAVLRHLAHHPRATAFVDGIVYIAAQHKTAGDLVQMIFEAFYQSDERCLPTETEVRRGLQDRQAFIILDSVLLPPSELEWVIDSAPRSAVAVATRERCLWGEVRSLALKGLPLDAAVALLEREIERPITDEERPAATTLCTVLGGHPLRMLRAAALVRERGLPPDGWTQDATDEVIVTELLAGIDDRQRRALLALSALPGMTLEAQHVAGIAELTEIEPALMMLVRRGLVVCTHARHQIADGVGDRLRRTEDLKPWLNRAITYFTSWAERNQRNTDALIEESDVLLRAQELAAGHRRWGEVLELGRLLEGALVVRARWGTWALSLDRCLAAAKALGDRSDEAWVLHQIGTRAVCLGDTGLARTSLSQALTLREAIDDRAAAAVSRQTLGFVVAPAPESHAERVVAPPVEPPPVELPAAAQVDLDSIRLDDEAPPPRLLPVEPEKSSGAETVFVATLLLVIVVSGLGYWTRSTGFSWQSWDVARVESVVRSGLEKVKTGIAKPAADAVRTATEVPVAQPPIDESLPSLGEPDGAATSGGPALPKILIFTSRPGSIAASGATHLCYAVSDVSKARIDPGIGEVSPASSLTCVRVTPPRTTTYQLTAYGRDEQQISQQLVVVGRNGAGH